MTTKTVHGNVGICPICGDAPIQHIQDGFGYTCQICVARAKIRREGGIIPGWDGICTAGFRFKLSKREREQAMEASRDSFKPHTACINCGFEWQQHMGYLCPSGDSTFLPLLDSHFPWLSKKDVL